MIAEEAIKELRDASDNEVRYGDTEHHYNEVMKRIEAFDMAIKALEQLEQQQRDCNTCKHSDNGNCAYTEECHECMWKSKYEQQPCEDCISRQRVLDIIKFEYKWLLDTKVYDIYTSIAFSSINAKIKALLPVTPTRPTGRWLMPQQDDGMSDPIYYQVRCSECGFDLDPQTWHMELHQYGADKYCPNCGTRMTESEEDE